MSKPTTDPCLLHCPWSGGDLCLRRLLSHEAIADHHLSLGVACGLRHVYFPRGLPPCVHRNGDVDWHYAEEEHSLNIRGECAV